MTWGMNIEHNQAIIDIEACIWWGNFFSIISLVMNFFRESLQCLCVFCQLPEEGGSALDAA